MKSKFLSMLMRLRTKLALAVSGYSRVISGYQHTLPHRSSSFLSTDSLRTLTTLSGGASSGDTAADATFSAPFPTWSYKTAFDSAIAVTPLPSVTLTYDDTVTLGDADLTVIAVFTSSDTSSDTSNGSNLLGCCSSLVSTLAQSTVPALAKVVEKAKLLKAGDKTSIVQTLVDGELRRFVVVVVGKADAGESREQTKHEASELCDGKVRYELQ